MRDKIGSLYLGFKVSTFGQRLNSSVFLIRRLLFATLTVVCAQNPNILIHAFLANNLLYFFYLGYVSPNETKLSQRQEFFNEVGLQIVTYHLALFPLTLTVDLEIMEGWSMIGAVGLIFFVNLSIVVFMTLINLRLSILKKRYQKRMKPVIE